MASDHDHKSATDSLLRRLLQVCLSQDWITLLFDLYRALRLWLNRQRREGMYEILDYEVVSLNYVYDEKPLNIVVLSTHLAD